MAAAAGSEAAYYGAYCNWDRGTSPYSCNGNGSPTTCSMNGGQYNTPACNGNDAWQALSVHHDAATFGWTEEVMMQCCSDSSNNAGTWAVKTCADTGSSPNFTSECGNSGSNRCKACFTPVSYSGGCSLSSSDSGYYDSNVGAEEENLCVTTGDLGECVCLDLVSEYSQCDTVTDPWSAGYMSLASCNALLSPDCCGPDDPWGCVFECDLN